MRACSDGVWRCPPEKIALTYNVFLAHESLFEPAGLKTRLEKRAESADSNARDYCTGYGLGVAEKVSIRAKKLLVVRRE